MSRKINIIGKRFDSIYIESEAKPYVISNRKIRRLSCICDCGKKFLKRVDVLRRSIKNGHYQSCGCDRSRYTNVTGKDNVNFNGYEDIRGAALRRLERSAKDRNLECTIDGEYIWKIYISQGRRCALTDMEVKFGRNNFPDENTASVDRIDNTKGYIEGNIQIVHKYINRMRGMMSIPEFVDWCKKVYYQHENQCCSSG